MKFPGQSSNIARDIIVTHRLNLLFIT